MIYVPYYDEIVVAEGFLPFSEKKVISEETLVSKTDAISEAKLNKGTAIEVDDVVLVYVLKKEDEFSQLTEMKAIPAWRVDYKKGNGEHMSVYINAVTGIVWEYIY